MENKIVAVHIAPSAIRIMEGSLSKDRLIANGHGIIKDAERFFTDGKLTHLREMAEEIVAKMKQEGIHGKNLYICYDNNVTVEMVDTPMETKTGKQGFFSFLKKDIGGGEGKKKKGGNVSALPNGVLEKAQNWGEAVNFRNDQEIRSVLSSMTRVERDLVRAINYEFAELGYKVLSIETPQTVMMYMRHANPYSYDNMGMLVLYLNNPNDMAWIYTFMKNTPRTAMRKNLAGATNWSLADRVVATCQKEVQTSQLRRPTVILAGDAFADYSIYTDVVDALTKEGFGICDIYDNIADDTDKQTARMDNALRVEIEGERSTLEQQVCGHYSVCMALLLRMMDSKPDNMMDPKDRASTKREALSQSRALLAAITVILVGITLFAGYQTFMWKNMERKLVSDAEIESRLEQATRDNANSSQHMQALNIGDTRYEKLLAFVSEHIGDTINVASIDTDDMFREISTNESQYAADNIQAQATADGGDASDASSETSSENSAESGESSGSSAGGKSVTNEMAQECIVLRGYAKDSASIKNFYSLLVGEDLGETELVGIQCISFEALKKDVEEKAKAEAAAERAAKETAENINNTINALKELWANGNGNTDINGNTPDVPTQAQNYQSQNILTANHAEEEAPVKETPREEQEIFAFEIAIY